MMTSYSQSLVFVSVFRFLYFYRLFVYFGCKKMTTCSLYTELKGIVVFVFGFLFLTGVDNISSLFAGRKVSYSSLSIKIDPFPSKVPLTLSCIRFVVLLS